MKVVQVVSSLSSNFGGSSVAALKLHQALLAAGVDAVMLTASYAQPHGGSVMTHDEIDDLHEAAPGVQVFAPSHPHPVQNSRGLLRAIGSEVPGADLVVIHGLHMLPMVVAGRAATRASVPYAIQVHGVLEPYEQQRSQLKKLLFERLVGRSLLSRAHTVIFAADSERSRASRLVRDEQAFVHPLGVDLPDPQEPAHLPRLSELYARTSRSKVVLFVGRLALKKHPDRLIEAWARADRDPDAALVIVGPDGHFTGAELRQLAQERGVADSTHVVGPLVGPELTWAYRGASTYALPSDNENFGITVAEAMLSGCHVITTTEVAAHEHLDASDSGEVIEANDESALVTSLETALRDVDRVDVSGQRARAYAETVLTWDTMAESLLQRIRRT